MDATLELLTVALLPGLAPSAIRAMRQRGPLGTLLLRPEEHADLLKAEAVTALRSGKARERARAEVRRAEAAGIRILGQDEADYPALLLQTYDPPPVLWVRGTLPAAGVAVAIVGARRATPQGHALARGMARELAAAGATIVSGLARGIDTQAHRGALDAAGRTVAVLGSGLDVHYPPENAKLADAVAASGAVLSEFPLGTKPEPWNFPRRNRVIAGLARAVVVVEAADKSGALVTARFALDEGREVLAVPGHPSAETARGTNALIRDGARLVRDAADVAEEIGLQLSRPVAPPEADPVLRALSPEAPASLEELHARSGRAIPELLARLAELEVAARVRRLPGPLFVRA